MNSSIVWLKTKRLLQFFLLMTVIAPVASAHEFWIEPTQYRVEPKSMIEAFLRNGENFVGSSVSYHKGSTARFEIFHATNTEQITPRLGDDPALALNVQQNGLHVVIHESPVSTIAYTKWDKFQRFADHKDFKNMLARHQERGLSEVYFKEAYTRFSKSLISVGDGVGNDQHFGLEIELVALQNPYTLKPDDSINVAGYYQGQLRPDAQIELFEKAPNGEVVVKLYRTDDNGMVELPVKSNHSYLVDMVVLRKPSKALAQGRGVVWETLWASLTFEVK